VTTTSDERGVLYVVSTPIGNLADMTLRALETLRTVGVVLAEDTRHSRKLLDHFEITTPLVAHHEHNEAKSTPALVERLQRGESMALITDAGTPLVSDPGARLVAAAIAGGVRVVPIPGASAVLAALVAAGLPADRFTFFGFLDRKGKERQQSISVIAARSRTPPCCTSRRTGSPTRSTSCKGADSGGATPPSHAS
jgi:16S rRNA (cytidine1402-2'-O)-methyltransferase